MEKPLSVFSVICSKNFIRSIEHMLNTNFYLIKDDKLDANISKTTIVSLRKKNVARLKIVIYGCIMIVQLQFMK